MIRIEYRTQELTSRLASLEAEHNAIYAELVPLAHAGADGRMKWRDFDLARWLCADVDAVRQKIVDDLHDFAVDDACAVALLGITEVLVLMDGKAPRICVLNYIANEMTALVQYLTDLGGAT